MRNVVFAVFLFQNSLSVFGQAKFIDVLYKNQMISDKVRAEFLKNPELTEDSEILMEILSNAKNVLTIDLNGKEYSTGFQLRTEIGTEILKKHFPRDSLNIKVSLKFETNDTSEVCPTYFTTINMVGEKFTEKREEKYCINELSEENAVNFIKKHSDVYNFNYFNYILLDRNNSKRIYKIIIKEYPYLIYYIKLNVEDFEEFGSFIENKFELKLEGLTRYYDKKIDKRFSYDRLNNFLETGRNTGIKIEKTNEEIINNFRKNKYGFSFPEQILSSGILAKNNSSVSVESGYACYHDSTDKPLFTMLNLFLENSNNLFTFSTYKDNIGKVQNDPFNPKRVVKISFVTNGKEYLKEWREETMPIGSDKDYLDGNNHVVVTLKDIVTLVNEVFKQNNIAQKYYLVNPYDADELPNSAILLDESQFYWINGYFPEIFWKGN